MRCAKKKRLNPLSHVVDLTGAPAVVEAGNFGFQANMKRALDNIDSFISSGLEREFWRVQSFQRGTKKYGPEYTAEEFASLEGASEKES